MKLKCDQCRCSLGTVTAEQEGQQARCEACGFEFVIPFQSADSLLEWAESAPWPLIEEGIRTGVARHQQERIVSQWIRLFEKRRENEIWRLEREKHGRVRSTQERLWEASEMRLKQSQELKALDSLSPKSLRQLAIDLFLEKGFFIEKIEGKRKNSCDFVVFRTPGEQEGIVRCLARENKAKVTARDLERFVAACILQGWTKGYFITSGYFTGNARTLAAAHSWLTLHDGVSLSGWIQDLREETKKPFLLLDYDPLSRLSNLKASYESKLISQEVFIRESSEILKVL